MSMELHVFVDDSRMPTRDQWQQAITDVGVPAVLYPELDLRRDRGFSPTTYNQRNSGFELYLDNSAACIEVYPQIAEQVGARGKCISFRFGGDIVEAATAISCAAALAWVADGVYYDPESDRLLAADTVLEGVRADLEALS
jgi:hypothetical protein